MRAHELEDRAIQATFVPSDPPRRSHIGLWRTDGTPAFSNAPRHDVELLRHANNTFKIDKVKMSLVPIADIVEPLLAADGNALSPTVASVRSIVRQALRITAKAKVQPSLTKTGNDAWRLVPSDPDDIAFLNQSAAAIPSDAWAIRGSTSPSEAVTELTAAVVDSFVRTAGAPLAAGHRAFAAEAPTIVDATAAVQSFEMSPDSRAPLLVLRVLPPAPGPDSASFVAALGIQSRGDQPRVLDMDAVWRAPKQVRGRFDSVEMSTLVTLRRAARVWPPLLRLLEQRHPDRMPLSEDEVDQLLGPVGRDLGSAGLSVLVAGELAQNIELTAVVRSVPRSGAGNSRFDLSTVVKLDWRAAIDGQSLTEDELRELAEAKRPLIRFRGQWLHIDSERVRRLRENRTVGASTALAAALGAKVELASGSPITVEGPLAAMASRLRGLDPDQEAEPPAALVGILRPYQRRGLAWLSLMADLGLGGVLADDMGLGKTVQVIALHLQRQAANPSAMLVICPASVVGNWEREINRFAPTLAVHRYHGQRRKLGKLGPGHVVLTTYGVARRDADLLARRQWGLVISDEAQAIKNPYSRTAKALRRIPGEARFALTGTPVQNHLADLWSLLDWATPGLLGSLETFRREFATPIEQGDQEATAQLQRLLRPFVLRRTKSDPTIVPDLPPKTETDEIVPLTTEQAALYQAVVDEVMAEIAVADGIQRRGLVLRLITRLKQICNHPEHLLAEGGKLAGRSGKLNATTALLETVKGEGEAALVFTQYVAMAELLESHLNSAGIRTLFLHGGQSLNTRQDLVDRFQAGEADAFLLSLRAGGTGLNLTRASHVIHYDRWWNPAVEDQASDRAWRIGQTLPVQVHRMICEGTIEDRISALLKEKRQLAAVVGAGEGWISDLGDDDLAQLVALSDPDGTELEAVE